MRPWQLLYIVALANGKYDATYLIGGTEKHRAILDPIFGLDKAITDAGVMLARMPPRVKARIGVGSNN